MSFAAEPRASRQTKLTLDPLRPICLPHPNSEDGSVFAYDTAVVNHRCPQKVIQLYESRLRFRPNPRGEAQPIDHFSGSAAVANAVGAQQASGSNATGRSTDSPAAAAIATSESSGRNSQDVSMEGAGPAASQDPASDAEASQAAANAAESHMQDALAATQGQGEQRTAANAQGNSSEESAGPLQTAVETAKEVAVAMSNAIGMEGATEPSQAASANGTADATAGSGARSESAQPSVDTSAPGTVNGDAETQSGAEANGAAKTLEPPSEAVRPSEISQAPAESSTTTVSSISAAMT